MKRTSLRARAGLVAVAIAASIVPLLSAPAANAAGVPQAGGASVRTPGGAAALSSGNSGTTFTLRLPAGAACGGDSANDGYRVQSYMVPASVDPSTLTFDASGPIPLGTGANFRQPLYDTLGSSYVNAQTANATTPPGPGPIIGIPDFNYGSVFVAGDIPPGAYNIGIACTQGVAGPTQMKEFWNVTKTFTTNGGDGFANVNWSVGAAPVAPVLTAVTPGDAQLTAAFTHTASSPASSYTATAAPQAGDVDCTAGSVTSPSQATTANIVLSGLVNACTYNVTVTANNGVGSPAVSNVLSGTPVLPPPPPEEVIYQELDVTVPPGALVLTQRCGVFGVLPAEPHSAQDPTVLTATTATPKPGTAPFTSWDYANDVPGAAQDPEFAEYPTPDPVTYPTHCAVDMGTAKLITSGAAAGQYYSAHGRLNQITVADFRDTDEGWTVNGTMGPFTEALTGNAGFSGDHLGWTPVKTSDSAPAGGYDQVAVAGSPVAPVTGGLAAGKPLGSAAAGSGIGIAEFDARLRLLIPASAVNANYVGTLTFTFV